MEASIDPITRAFAAIDRSEYDPAIELLAGAMPASDVHGRKRFVKELRRQGNRSLKLQTWFHDDLFGDIVEAELIAAGFTLFEAHTNHRSWPRRCPANVALPFLTEHRLSREDPLLTIEGPLKGVVKSVQLTPLNWDLLWSQRTETHMADAVETLVEVGEFPGFELIDVPETSYRRTREGILIRHAELGAPRPKWMRQPHMSVVECSCWWPLGWHNVVSVLVRFDGSIELKRPHVRGGALQLHPNAPAGA